MSSILGIDPGNKGALAFLHPEEGFLRIEDMPTFEFFTNKNRVKTDAVSIVDLISDMDVGHVYIEDVASSPQMGVTSAFSFGEGKGIIIGICAGLGKPITMVKPTQWKKAMRVPADKAATTHRASQLFPLVAHRFRGPRGAALDGRAEAALIALYAAMELSMTPKEVLKPWQE